MRWRLACWLPALGVCSLAGAQSLETTFAIRHDLSTRLDVTSGRYTPRTPRDASEIANRFPTPPDPLQQVSLGVQRLASGIPAPQTVLAIPGLDALEAGRLVPADPVLDVSSSHLWLWVNTAFAIHDRLTGQRLAGPVAGNALWAGFGGPCESSNEGDPLVVYDDFADRWVLSQMAISAQRQCVAVSVSSDPFGPYARYEFAFPLKNDYAKLAVWTDGGNDSAQSAYLLSVHEFDGNQFAGSALVALERGAMLDGRPARMQRVGGLPDYGIQPVHLEGPNHAVPGSCAPFVHFALPPYPAGYRFWHLCPNWSDAGAGSAHGPIELPADRAFVPYLEPAAQPAGAPGLPAFGAYTMYRASARRLGPDAPEALSLAVTHTVRAGPAQGALRWTRFELGAERIHTSGFGDAPVGAERLGARITESGSYAPDGNTRFLGAGALDASGNLALGYHVSGPAQAPVLRRTGRQHQDPPGLLQDEVACGSTATGVQLASHGRFGDYASLALDPVEHCTAYFAGQYLPLHSGADWATQVCAWRQPGCGAPDYAYAPPVEPQFEFCGRERPELRLPFRLGVLGGYRGEASLQFSGLPAPLIAFPSLLPIPGGGELRLGGLDQVAAGSYTLSLTARSGGAARIQQWPLRLWQDLQVPPTPLMPPVNAEGVRWRPEFRFAALPGARSYRIEVSADPDFGSLAAEAMLQATQWQPAGTLSPDRRYWWRVRGENACGVSEWSAPRSFTTRASGCASASSRENVVALDFAKDTAGFSSHGIEGPAFERQDSPGLGLDGMVYGVPNSPIPALSSAESPEWTLPTGLEALRLELTHAARLKSAGDVVCIDGARLEWSVDGGSWQPVPPERYDQGGYDGRSGSTHPLTGDLWCRSDRLDSVLDLAGTAGRRLRLRLALATVGYGSAPLPNGYWLSALSIHGCRPP
ncbi:MAG: hypothetical protein MUE46_01030 [Xanthomonadales bacterium]|jgi:hypothetical protein|nr:hypothetical protein [Xanthomonadales bacterium]